MTKGRGEILEPAEFVERKVNLIKPLNLGISAKEAYTKFSQKNSLHLKGRENFVNDLEWAVIDDYEELQFIKTNYPAAVMTGSGSTYYSLTEEFANHDDYWVFNDLKTINNGICEVL